MPELDALRLVLEKEPEWAADVSSIAERQLKTCSNVASRFIRSGEIFAMRSHNLLRGLLLLVISTAGSSMLRSASAFHWPRHLTCLYSDSTRWYSIGMDHCRGWLANRIGLVSMCLSQGCLVTFQILLCSPLQRLGPRLSAGFVCDLGLPCHLDELSCPQCPFITYVTL